MPVTLPSHLSRDARRILSLTDALIQSGSQLEDTYWENMLTTQMEKILSGRKNKTLESILEVMADKNPEAYEILFEKAETMTESISVTHQDVTYDALLFSAPVTAWTRYTLPEGKLTDAQRTALLNGLHETIVTSSAQVALMPNLLNIEQMPASFHDTRNLTEQLTRTALCGTPTPAIAPAQQEDFDGILADSRFLVGIIVVPQGQPLFQWQTSEEDITQRRKHCQQAWSRVCKTILGPLFTGCHVSYLAPDAYYTNNREADHKIRPLVIRAAVTWLNTAINIAPHELQATIIGCGETVLQEYRIGFSRHASNTVIYGCLWPVLSKEEAFAELIDADGLNAIEQIAATLSDIGVTDIKRLPGLHSCDFCEDCGAPYFPDIQGELHHPELPDDANLEPVQFH